MGPSSVAFFSAYFVLKFSVPELSKGGEVLNFRVVGGEWYRVAPAYPRIYLRILCIYFEAFLSSLCTIVDAHGSPLYVALALIICTITVKA
jgi:hypothetical protein